MSAYEQWIDSLPDVLCREMIEDNEKFRIAGKIGECSLRSAAEDANVRFGSRNGIMVIWMDRIAADCYRRFALRYMREHKPAGRQLTGRTNPMPGLLMKYFVLKPGGSDAYAAASRCAMRRYADLIRSENPELCAEIREWADRESAESAENAPHL